MDGEEGVDKVNPEQKLAQWRLDLDAICGPVVKQARRLTGLEKAGLERDPLEDIQNEYDSVFGRSE